MAGTEVKRSLDRLLWIGGPPDSGKTTVARIIAERHGPRVYSFDRQEMAHFSRADPGLHPALWTARPEVMSPEERWLGSSPEEMARATIASWSERFGMALDDLRAMPLSPAVLVEGSGLFPELVAPLISDPRQAIWLVPTEAFKRASALERGKPGSRHETSDPERATHNLIERDLLMDAHIRRQATALGLTMIEVDGLDDARMIAARVEAHFGPYLTSASASGS